MSAAEKTGHPKPAAAKTGHQKCVRSGPSRYHGGVAAVVSGHSRSVSVSRSWSPRVVFAAARLVTKRVSAAEMTGHPRAKTSSSLDRSPENVFAAVQADTRVVCAAVIPGHSRGVSGSLSWSPKGVFAPARLVTKECQRPEMTGHQRPAAAKTGHQKSVRSGLSSYQRGISRRSLE